MPKKKRQAPRTGSSRTSSRNRRPVSIRPLVDEFAATRQAAGQDPDDAWIVEPLAELKRDLLAGPDPTVWQDDDLADLLLDIVPRKIQLDAVDRERLVPTLVDFFAFLEGTGRWSASSTPYGNLLEALTELAPAVQTALADPARRSMGGNIVAFALSEGTDLSDDHGLAAAMDRFNSLSFEERAAITETGRLPGAGMSDPDDTGRPRAGAAFGLAVDGRPPLSLVPDLDDGVAPDGDDWDGPDLDLADIWPAFLGDPVDPDSMPAMPSPEEQAAALSGTELVRRADVLLDWLGTGRKVTATGALRQADTAEVLQLLGLGTGKVRSMWEVGSLSLLWGALVTGGFLEVDGTTARPAGKVVDWAGPGSPPASRVDACSILFAAALTMFLSQQEDGRTIAQMPPLTFLALTKAVQPDGLTLPPSADVVDDYVAICVRSDLAELTSAGVLTVENDRFRLLPQLLPVLDTVLHTIVGELLPS